MGIIAAPAPSDDWQVVTLEDAGLRPNLGARLAEDVEAGTIEGLHALLVFRGGRLAFEHYADGDDERWGEPLPGRRHGPGLLHDVRSVTKSVVSLLYGIALARGLVPKVTARILDQFPDYPDLAADPIKRRMTVAHALSMRLGLAWDEDLAYSDPQNGERQMEAAADRYRNVLERPIVHRPGAVFSYCGGATAILGHLIARGAGQRLEKFAAEELFSPLGIGEFEWVNGSDGEAAASSGLRLKARDAARIGQMVLDHGLWRGRQVVPRTWLTASMRPRALVEKGMRYGYQWWLGRLVRSDRPWYGAFGNGGQRILVIPSLRMCVVIFAGNYNKSDQWKMPVKVMSRIIMPSLLRG